MAWGSGEGREEKGMLRFHRCEPVSYQGITAGHCVTCNEMVSPSQSEIPLHHSHSQFYQSNNRGYSYVNYLAGVTGLLGLLLDIHSPG